MTIISLTSEVLRNRRSKSILKDSEARFRKLVEHSTERRLAESELKYRILFDKCDFGIALFHGFTCVEVNPRACDIFGWQKDDIIGKALHELSPADPLSNRDEMDLVFEKFSAALAGEIVDFEWEYTRKDGSNSDLEVNLSRSRAGENWHILATIRDMTDKKTSERREKEREEQLLRAAKMVSLGTLISGVAHEINNPNNYIRLGAENLSEFWQDISLFLKIMDKEHGPLSFRGVSLSTADEMIDSMIHDLYDGSVRIEKLITSLNEFTRHDEGERFQPIDLNEVVESGYQIAQSTIQKATRNYSFTPAKNLPMVSGIFRQIEHVVVSLITNACQSLRSNDKAIRISTTFNADDSVVCIFIEDEGIGIPREHMRQVFDPFFTTTRNTGSTGLGLSVSHQILLNHHGELSLSSELETGTTAKLSIPVKYCNYEPSIASIRSNSHRR